MTDQQRNTPATALNKNASSPANNAEGPEGSVGVNSRLSAVPETEQSEVEWREGCELLSFELPGGEAGVGIQNVCKSSGTPERALAVAVPQQFSTPKELLAGAVVVAGRCWRDAGAVAGGAGEQLRGDCGARLQAVTTCGISAVRKISPCAAARQAAKIHSRSPNASRPAGCQQAARLMGQHAPAAARSADSCCRPGRKPKAADHRVTLLTN
jgi:hypothetical protein